MAIPIIDERIKHVGPATLRKYDALKLRGLRDLMVIQDGDEPLAVLIPYEMYLEMQREVAEGKKAISEAVPRTVYDPNWFQSEGPVDVLPKFNPDDYGKMPAGLPVTIDDGCEPNGGTDQNPDMAYSKHSYVEPANERRSVPRSGSTLDMPHHEGSNDIANGTVAPSSGPHPPIKGIPFIIENEPEPFQSPRCHHCGKEGPRLCQECFVAGHRAVANCQQCTENNQLKG